MTVLVTGCAGFIGSHLTEALLQDGLSVVGVDCFNDNYHRRNKLANLERAREWDSFEFIPIELSQADLLDILAEVGTVYHLAAEPGVRSSWGGRFGQYLRNNVQATQNVLEAVHGSGEPHRVVYASSSSVYGQAETRPTREDVACQPMSPYGVTKLSAEHLCSLYHVNHGLDTVSLRYFSVYGPRQRPDMAFSSFCRAITAGDPLTVYGDGEQSRDFTFVEDVVRATRAAGETPDIGGAVLNIGGGDEVTVNRALDLLGQYAGRSLDVTYLDVQHGDVRSTSADVTGAREVLGFEPRTRFEDGLRQEFEWFMARPSLVP